MDVEFRVKRVYEKPAADDGCRVLVDRLWPRGVAKAAATIDVWAKELTPSDGLRKWFHQNRDATAEFARRYRAELAERRDEIRALLKAWDRQTVTLVTAVKDPDGGHVGVLVKYLLTRRR